MGRSGRGRFAVLVIAGLGLALTACGDDDDDPPAAAAEEGGDENADNNDDGDNAGAEDEGDDSGAEDNGDDAGAEDNGDDDTIKVDDINDIPDECIDLFTDMLEKIEPIVEDVDWENADLSEMEGIQEELDAEVSAMDDDMEEAGCNDYELSDDSSMDALIELARDKAPGTVAYFEFIQNMQADFSDITVPDVDEGDGGDEGDDGGDLTGLDELGVPQDCEGAIAFVRGMMDEFDSYMDMNMEGITQISAAQLVITSECSVNEMNDFYSDPEVSEWMSAT